MLKKEKRRDMLLSLYRLGKIAEASGYEEDSTQHEIKELEKNIHPAILSHSSRWLRDGKNPVALVGQGCVCAECGKKVSQSKYEDALDFGFVICEHCGRHLLPETSIG